MKLVAAGIIEFPSEYIMANKCNILITFAIIFLASLSLSSAFIKRNVDISEDFENHFDLQPSLREKRQENVRENIFFTTEHDPIKLEELSEFQTVHDRRAIGEETKKIVQKDDRKNEEQSSTSKTSNDTEEDTQNDTFSYRNVHDLIQALILVDEIDIAEKLQQLREIENATESESLSKLPKRHATASGSLLGENLWDDISVDDLDAHSCEREAFEHSHLHLSGTIVHELCCELRKCWHYCTIIGRNLKSELTLGPLIAGEIIGDGFFHHIRHIFHAILKQPHHLLILPDIIRDAIPIHSFSNACLRLKDVFFKVVHFVGHLFHSHIRHALGHFFLHHHLGVHLREKLLDKKLTKLHHWQNCLHGLGLILPEYLPIDEHIAEPAASTAISSATATATATATASSDVPAFIPDYYGSLGEVLSSFRGFYDGYYASGMPHLIRAGVKSFSTSSVFSWITSSFSWITSNFSRIPFLNYFGYGPIKHDTISTASASASASSAVNIGSPVVVPAAPIPVESEVATSAATATATTTTVTETEPVVAVEPVSVPIESSIVSSNVATAAATVETVASPVVVPNYQVAPTPLSTSTSTAVTTSNTVVEEAVVPCAPVVESTVVSNTVENTVSESSSVAVASPEVAPVVENLGGTVATTSASASASASASSADVVSSPIAAPVPFTLPYLDYSPGPILSNIAPIATSTSTANAAASSGSTLIEPSRYQGLDLDIDHLGYPLSHPQASLAGVSSAASASASAGGGSAASAAGAVSANGLNFILPRHQIIGALGHDYLLPGDIITIPLRNKAVLFGRILDASSPISFHFLRPKLRASLFRHGGRVWNILPRNFKDPECIRLLNNPRFLNYHL